VSGRIATRVSKAGDKTKLDWVFADAKDDRDRGGRSFGSQGGVFRGRGDHGHATADGIGQDRW
jgi:hypothetical protein